MVRGLGVGGGDGYSLYRSSPSQVCNIHIGGDRGDVIDNYRKRGYCSCTDITFLISKVVSISIKIAHAF